MSFVCCRNIKITEATLSYIYIYTHIVGYVEVHHSLGWMDTMPAFSPMDRQVDPPGLQFDGTEGSEGYRIQ